MARVRVFAHKGKKDKDGTLPLYVRITHGNARRYVSLGLRVRAKDWSHRLDKMLPGREHEGTVNDFVNRSRAEAEGAVLAVQASGLTVTPDRLKDAVQAALEPEDVREDRAGLLPYFMEIIEGHRRAGREWTAQKQTSVWRKLETFAKREGAVPLSADRLTPRFVRRWATWMRADPTEEDPDAGRGNSKNTAALGVKLLRTWCRQAVREGLMERDPTADVRMPTTTAKKEKLELEEVEALAALDDLTEREGLTRDVFLFALYMAGMRFADVAGLEWKDVKGAGESRRVVYRMGKTEKDKDVLLIPKAAEILDRYIDRRGRERFVFPLLDGYEMGSAAAEVRAVGAANAITNKYLKRLADKAAIEKNLSMHIARHSFANIALEAGWEMAAISKALAHGSLRQTEIYLRELKQEVVDERHRDLF